MTIHIQQSIHIQSIKIGALTNSSVLQIGTAGVITPSSHLYNTGGFKTAAPAIPQFEETIGETGTEPSLVPLS
ncbi:spore germination protein GerPB [Lederbergia galactosidilytica]|uniref:Spore gernimation protein n=1 Tax=Lederbergia galactosidilytica TaxID=217031 RepID=A0A0Q9Y753_9BACI|nr:spore germination protein GerPB [Lederbergia galactosidilytica]KRG16669.1 spore gernimation protein [Virgibacillus soli]KRG16710.1 spore gernimation protein [Lederbergia galactosidilytica]MBP1915695.1 spore germination protein PB [Lederbergia galactosidilytica]OAK67746.1 spore gernimation protein [Lederbergia galactosidilytica]